MKKLMLRGWFTCVFVCLSCFLISEKLSAEVNGGDEVRTVTLNMWNVSLKEILTEIEKQAGVTFSYESSLLKEFQKTFQSERCCIGRLSGTTFCRLSVRVQEDRKYCRSET